MQGSGREEKGAEKHQEQRSGNGPEGAEESATSASEKAQATSERMKDAVETAKNRAAELEGKAEETVEQTGQKLAERLRHWPTVSAIAAGGAAFAIASVVGAAEVAVAAAGAYAAYRWLGGEPLVRSRRAA